MTFTPSSFRSTSASFTCRTKGMIEVIRPLIPTAKGRSFSADLDQLSQWAVLATIDNVIAAADEDDLEDVLAEIVNVAFEGRHDDRSLAVGRGRADRKEELHDFHDGTPGKHDFQEVELFRGAFGVQGGHGRLDAMRDDVLWSGPARDNRSACETDSPQSPSRMAVMRSLNPESFIAGSLSHA